MLYACKVVHVDDVSSEVEIMYKIRGQTYVPQIHYDFIEDDHQYIVMDYVKGRTLHKYAASNKLSSNQIKLVIAELVIAYEQLHTINICHKDVHLNNIMIDENGHIMLIDFDQAIYVDRDTKNPFEDDWESMVMLLRRISNDDWNTDFAKTLQEMELTMQRQNHHSSTIFRIQVSVTMIVMIFANQMLLHFFNTFFISRFFFHASGKNRCKRLSC